MESVHRSWESDKATEAGTTATITPERIAVVNQPTPATMPAHLAHEAWRSRRAELTQWVWDHLINRTDMHGVYTALEDRGKPFTRKDGTQDTVPSLYTPLVELTPHLVRRHLYSPYPYHV